MRARSAALVVLLVGGCGGPAGEREGAVAGAVTPATGATGAMDAAGAASPAARGARESEGFRAALAAGVRGRGGGSFEVDSFLATVALEELASGSSGLSITAHAGADGIDGYEVRGVAQESLYGRLGLRDGDRVVAINGAPATSPGRVLGAFAGAGRQLVVEIEREGVSSFVDLRLVDGLAWSATLAAQGITAPSIPMEVHSVALSEEALAAAAAAGVGGNPGGGGAQVGSAKASGSGGAPLASAKAGGSGGASVGSASGGVSTSAACTSANECSIRRSEVSSLISAPEKAMSQARATAVSRGYRLAGVKKGSAVERLGFRDGDVIRSVNGYALNDQAAALALYMSLQSTSVFRVNYERGGASATKVIRTI